MNRDLYIHTLQGMRDVFAHEHMDTRVESLDVAIWAIETQEQLQKERDAVMSAEGLRKYNVIILGKNYPVKDYTVSMTNGEDGENLFSIERINNE